MGFIDQHTRIDGDQVVKASKIIMSDITLINNAGYLEIRELDETTWAYIRMAGQIFNSFMIAGNDAAKIQATNTDGYYIFFTAKATGGVETIIGGLFGDTDPYMACGGGTKNKFAASGKIYFTDLPVADPSVAGQLWNNGGALSVSAG